MAEAFVRTATEADVPEIARIQLTTWQSAYAELLPVDVLAALDVEQAEVTWRETVAHGPATVYVAVEGSFTVGFCVAGPAPADEVAAADGTVPDDAAAVGLVGALHVEPRWGRRGHGGRLLGTAAAALLAAGAHRGVCWIPEADEVTRKFYGRAGWAPDGTARTLDAGGQPLRELRLSGPIDLKLT